MTSATGAGVRVVAGVQADQLARGEVVLETGLLQHDPDALAEGPAAGLRVVAEHRHGPGVARAVPLEDLDGRGLAGAVGPEQRDDLALADRQVEPVDRGDAPVDLAQTGDLDGRHARTSDARPAARRDSARPQ